jgi:hypothetical protein
MNESREEWQTYDFFHLLLELLSDGLEALVLRLVVRRDLCS